MSRIEPPDELPALSESAADADLSLGKKKTRRPLPAFGSLDGPPLEPPTREQIDEAMFG